MEHLVRLPGLESLILWQTRITDAGLERLLGLSRLRALDLRGTDVTDAGLALLEPLGARGELRSLETVHLDGTRVTARGVARLRAAAPRWYVEW